MATTKWSLDPTHSEIGFKIRHLMITNVSGSFTKFSADVNTDEDDFSTARIKATIDMSSITTNNLQRDEHLRNSDFFEVETHPEMHFESTTVKKVDSETYTVYGNLTLKGITRPVTLNVEHSGIAKDPWGNEKAGFTVNGKINRTEWGVNFNAALETGGVVLSEDVKIHGELQFVKQAVAVAV